MPIRVRGFTLACNSRRTALATPRAHAIEKHTSRTHTRARLSRRESVLGSCAFRSRRLVRCTGVYGPQHSKGKRRGFGTFSRVTPTRVSQACDLAGSRFLDRLHHRVHRLRGGFVPCSHGPLTYSGSKRHGECRHAARKEAIRVPLLRYLNLCGARFLASPSYR